MSQALRCRASGEVSWAMTGSQKIVCLIEKAFSSSSPSFLTTGNVIYSIVSFSRETV